MFFGLGIVTNLGGIKYLIEVAEIVVKVDTLRGRSLKFKIDKFSF